MVCSQHQHANNKSITVYTHYRILNTTKIVKPCDNTAQLVNPIPMDTKAEIQSTQCPEPNKNKQQELKWSIESSK